MAKTKSVRLPVDLISALRERAAEQNVKNLDVGRIPDNDLVEIAARVGKSEFSGLFKERLAMYRDR